MAAREVWVAEVSWGGRRNHVRATISGSMRAGCERWLAGENHDGSILPDGCPRCSSFLAEGSSILVRMAGRRARHTAGDHGTGITAGELALIFRKLCSDLSKQCTANRAQMLHIGILNLVHS